MLLIFFKLIAVVITGSHAYNVFSEKGFSQYQIDVELNDSYDVKLNNSMMKANLF